MKKSKAIFVILAIAVVTLLAGQPIAQAGQDLSFWPLTPDARGETFYGTLLIVYKVVTPNGLVCEGFEPEVTMTFHLTLFKNRSNSWRFMDTDEGPFCLSLDVINGEQQAAILRFLNGEVLNNLKGGKFSQIFLKKVNADFYDTRLEGQGSPEPVGGYPVGTIVEYTVADVEVVGAK